MAVESALDEVLQAFHVTWLSTTSGCLQDMRAMTVKIRLPLKVDCDIHKPNIFLCGIYPLQNIENRGKPHTLFQINNLNYTNSGSPKSARVNPPYILTDVLSLVFPPWSNFWSQPIW